MVERLYIKNFQSHKETDIQFLPGVNVIIGSTDSGKSAIMRALKMAVLNKPAGADMRSHWGGETSVLVEFAEGNVVERVKGTQEIYRLNEMEFKAFRTDIPEEIKDAVNISEQNFQGQLDSPFLLSNTSGEVASFFNQIARIDKIDTSLKAVQSWLNKLASKLSHEQDSWEQKQVDLAAFSYIDALEEEVEELEEMENRKNQLGKQITDLQGLCDAFSHYQEKIQNKSIIISAEVDIDKIIIAYQKAGLYQKTINDLQDICLRYEKTQERVDLKLAVLKAERGVGIALDLIEEKKAIRTDEKAISEQITRHNVTSERLKEQETALLTYQKKFEFIFPDVCPLCDTPKKKIK